MEQAPDNPSEEKKQKSARGALLSALRAPLLPLWRSLPLPLRASLKIAWQNPTVRWLLIIVLVVFFGSLLAQILGFANTLFGALVTAVEALFLTPLGRTLLSVAATLAFGAFLLARIRAETTRMLRARSAARYLTALKHMVHRRYDAAARELSRVVEGGSQLSQALPGFAHLREDAYLKLALCHAERGQLHEGIRCLELVAREGLPPELRRAYDEVRALLHDRSPEFLPETKVAELRRALGKDGRNVRLLRALVARLVEVGDSEAAAEAQARVVAALGKRVADAERTRLAYLRYRHAWTLLRDARREVTGDAAEAAGIDPLVDDPLLLQDVDADARKRAVVELGRAQKADPELALAHVLAGNLHLAGGNRHAALEAWSRHASPPAMLQVERLLETSTASPQELYGDIAGAIPAAGVWTRIAGHALANGDAAFARRVLEGLAAAGVSSPEHELLHGDACRAMGDAQAAERHYQKGVERFLRHEH